MEISSLSVSVLVIFLVCNTMMQLSQALSSSASTNSAAKPIDPSGWPDRFPAKEHCSKCGLCETTFVSRVSDACAFLGDGMGRMDQAEQKVHGRQRDLSSMQWSTSNPSTSTSSGDKGRAEEARFGILHEPVRLAKGKKIADAQWTGVVTGIAVSMLESGMVDAVVCISASGDNDNSSSKISTGEGDKQWSYPEPIVARTVEEVLKGRGVKPALAPSLRVVDEIQKDASIRKLLFCGVGCSVQAFRAIQDDLNLEEVYVLGTNCVDNSPTPEAAQRFLREGVQIDATESVRGYEFMQDFKVHVKTKDGYIKKPYFSLPGTIAKPSIATSCLACFDYTNGLADVVVGYMGAPLASHSRMDESYQTLTIRNERGSKMVQTAIEANRLQLGDIATGTGGHEQLASATVAADSIVLDMVGSKVPEEGMPVIMGNVMAFVISNYVGPRGINFARYSIDYHILRNYLHVLQEWGEDRATSTMPHYARDIVNYYLSPSSDGTLAKLKSQIQKLDQSQGQ